MLTPHRRAWTAQFSMNGVLNSILMQGLGDDCELEQDLEGHDLQRGFVRRFEDNRACGSGLLYLQPACCTDTPAVARLEAGKAVLWHWRRKVVAQLRRDGQELLRDDAAHGMY